MNSEIINRWHLCFLYCQWFQCHFPLAGQQWFSWCNQNLHTSSHWYTIRSVLSIHSLCSLAASRASSASVSASSFSWNEIHIIDLLKLIWYSYISYELEANQSYKQASGHVSRGSARSRQGTQGMERQDGSDGVPMGRRERHRRSVWTAGVRKAVRKGAGQFVVKSTREKATKRWRELHFEMMKISPKPLLFIPGTPRLIRGNYFLD